jgi:hypothetical protein
LLACLLRFWVLKADKDLLNSPMEPPEYRSNSFLMARTTDGPKNIAHASPTIPTTDINAAKLLAYLSIKFTKIRLLNGGFGKVFGGSTPISLLKFSFKVLTI